MFNFRSLLPWGSDPASLSQEEKVTSQAEPHRDSDDQKMVLSSDNEPELVNSRLRLTTLPSILSEEEKVDSLSAEQHIDSNCERLVVSSSDEPECVDPGRVTTALPSSLAVDDLFSTFSLMEKAVRDYAAGLNFRVGRNPKQYFSSEESSQKFSSNEKIPRRGQFYCLHPSCDHFNIGFSWSKKHSSFSINRVELEHNGHTLQPPDQFGGRILKTYQTQLTTEEHNVIAMMAPLSFNGGVGTIRDLLMYQFPHWDYSSRLLHRVIRIERERAFGKDPHQINRLYDQMQDVKASGGTYSMMMDDSGRLSRLFCIENSRTPYMQAYGDFAILDGTHCISMYRLVCLIVTLVDSLGKSVMCGFGLVPSENADDVDAFLEEICLPTDVCVMTDGAFAFELVCEKRRLLQLHCTHHEKITMFKSVGGLGSEAETFRREASAAIHSIMASEEILDAHIKAMLEKYSPLSRPAAAYLKKLYSKRSKVCRTYTAKHFTAASEATSRGEGSNSRFDVLTFCL